MSTLEVALAKLGELTAWLAEHPEEARNEASTRFHLVDRILRECLGWPPEAIAVETYEEGQYSDYELGSPNRLAVIEAKREGDYFELPEGSLGEVVSLATLRAISPDLEKALDQATSYAQARGIPVAAVANGTQLVVFLGSRSDGVAPAEGTAVVFVSLDDMAERIGQLLDCLSPAGVAARRVTRHVLTGRGRTPPEKLSARIHDYPGYKNRNPDAAKLQILGGLFIDDLVGDPRIEQDFLESSYCTSGALSQYALVSRAVLNARYSAYFDQQGEVSSSGAADKDGLSADLLNDMMAAGLAKRPIVLLGDVGVGKTTFVRHLIRVDAVDELEDSIVLYVDFGSRPALAEDLKGYVYREFRRQLRDENGVDVEERGFVRSVYRPELQRFGTGIYSDLAEIDPNAYRMREMDRLNELASSPESHLRRSIEHLLKAQRRRTVVFLDNVDQRPPDFQESVFLIAQSLAETWDLSCFVSLRPETFYRSKASGSLSAYQPRVFTIAPPRVDQVIYKRLAFARRELSEFGRLPTFPAGVTMGSDTLDSYLAVLERAFHQEHGIVEFVDNMSGGNVRKALGFLLAFVGSGHVNTTKILGSVERTNRYDIPLHEFVRAVMYGDHEYYDPRDVDIINVLDVVVDDPREHFLVPLLVSYVDRIGRAGPNEGYVSTERCGEFLQSLGYTPDSIEYAQARAIRGGLLDPYPRPDGGGEADMGTAVVLRLRITSSGAYMVKKLLGMFSYIDAVVVDTPICDAGARQAIGAVDSVADRVKRAETFSTYLSQAWSAVSDEGLPFDWEACAGNLRGELERVRGAIGLRELPLS